MALVRNDVGLEWFESHEARHRREESHPLVQWNYEATLFLNCTPASDARPPQAALRMAALGSDIAQLRQAAVLGVEERLAKMLGGSTADFEPAVHELACAAEYLRGGRTVTFMAETTARTPDLLIDGVEVECKHKVILTKDDLARHSRVQDLQDALEKRVRVRPDGHGVRVEVDSKVAPSRELLAEVGRAAQDLLQSSRGTSVAARTDAHSFRIKRLPPARVSHGQLAFLPRGADFAQIVGKFEVLDDGTLESRSSCIVIVRIEQEAHRLASLRASLKTGCKQLSGTRAGVVEVEWTSITGSLPLKELPKVGEVILDVMRQNSRLSAVILVIRSFAPPEDEQAAIVTNHEVLLSHTARHGLPEGWIPDGWTMQVIGA